MSSNQSSSLKSGVSSIAGGLEATSANLLKSIPSSGSLGIDTTSASLLRSIPSSARILQSTEFLSSDKILQLFTAAARDEAIIQAFKMLTVPVVAWMTLSFARQSYLFLKAKATVQVDIEGCSFLHESMSHWLANHVTDPGSRLVIRRKRKACKMVDSFIFAPRSGQNISFTYQDRCFWLEVLENNTSNHQNSMVDESTYSPSTYRLTVLGRSRQLLSDFFSECIKDYEGSNRSSSL